jgi:hypothetical protein
MIHLYDALLAATEVVDQDLTDVSDDEVVRIVGRYVRNQDGVDFSRRPGTDEAWDVAGLVRHVRRSIADAPAASTSRDEESRRTSRIGEEVVAESPTGALMRFFCQIRGIPLPYRPDPRDGHKAPGLADALRRAGGTKREPSSIVVITDFDSAGELRALVAAARLAKTHGHAITFVVPDAPTLSPAPKDALEGDLSLVYGRGEMRRMREARAEFGRLGIPVLPLGTSQSAKPRHPGAFEKVA